MKSILALFLICSIASAEDVKYLKKDEIAPFTGYLFSPPKELELRLINEKFPILEKQLELQKDINSLLEERLQNDKSYIKSLEGTRDRGLLRETGYFILGALLTGFIASNVGR
jgi:hypothetical protein